MANDGEEALALLKKKEVDLIITDYFMPNLNGVEMILALRASGSSVPIIALTAATIGDEQDELFAAGSNLVLSKPLKVEDLTSCINTLLPIV